MSLLEEVNKQMAEAMKSGDEIRVSTLRMVISGCGNAKIAKGSELTDEEVIDVIAKGAKQRRESIESFEGAGRQDLADKEKKELEILQEFLPKPMTEAEITELVDKVILETDASSPGDIGKVMGRISPLIKGRADGGLVSSIVKSKLG